MQFALVEGSRRTATPRHVGQCPSCYSSVRSACGSLISWHWKHIQGVDCDPWSEPESDWHRWWKGLFPVDCREVVIGPHRADIATDTEIIELQHSPITGDMIAEREAFYGERMMWIFDMDQYRDSVVLTGGDRVGFRFSHPKKAIASCQRRVFIDCGGGVILEPKVWHDDRRGFGVVHDVAWLNPVSKHFRGTMVADTAVRPSDPVTVPMWELGEDWKGGGENPEHRDCGYAATWHRIGVDGRVCCPNDWRSFRVSLGTHDTSFLDVKCDGCKGLRSAHVALGLVSYRGRVFDVRAF